MIEETINKLIETYDPKLLDDVRIRTLSKEIYKIAETDKDKIVHRKVLMELIRNHKNGGSEKPVTDFIGGPCTLSCHMSEKYNKMIYIFGEYHEAITNCDVFQEGSDIAEIMMLVEDFIYILIDKTDVFIDILLEVPAIERKQTKYKDSYTGIKNSRSMTNLFNKLQKCIQYDTRHDNACRLSRVHYFDIRSINEDRYSDVFDLIFETYCIYFSYNITVYTNYNNYNNYKKEIVSEPKLIQKEKIKYYKRQKSITEKTREDLRNLFLTEKHKVFIDLLDHLIDEPGKIEEFFLFQMYSNIYVDHELTKIPEQDLVEKIKTFFNENTKKIIRTNETIWIENIKVILDFLTEKSTKYDDYDFVNSVIAVFVPCFEFVCTIPDIYTISRMFKEFNIKKLAYKDEVNEDQPKRAHNIIVYSGNKHSIMYRKFLEFIGFEEISSTNMHFSGQTCIDVREFPLPFFSMGAIDTYQLEKADKAYEEFTKKEVAEYIISRDNIIEHLEDEYRQIISLDGYGRDEEVIRRMNELVPKYRAYLFSEEERIKESSIKEEYKVGLFLELAKQKQKFLDLKTMLSNKQGLTHTRSVSLI
uniref:Uncharacterized protein n=1 Tax=viral metagenome TaxID=1070528 RepID=A0A6C0H493_9ZZZZ